MIDEIDELSLDQLGDVPFYFIYNKYGETWKKDSTEVYLRTLQKVQKFNRYTIDHCMQTRFNGQPCPASTQINIYRDGSIRRCPYQPIEPENADYSHGCALIRSIDGTNK
jgi:hypothetical protein